MFRFAENAVYPCQVNGNLVTHALATPSPHRPRPRRCIARCGCVHILLDRQVWAILKYATYEPTTSIVDLGESACAPETNMRGTSEAALPHARMVHKICSMCNHQSGSYES